MNKIELTDGCYAASWGLTGFYDDCYETFKKAIEAPDDFEADWGCKKEIDYCNVRREGGQITVSVTAWMDDIWEQYDLIYDALAEIGHEEYEFSDEAIDSIIEWAIDAGLEEYSTCTEEIPASADIDEICKTIDRLENEAGKNNREMFKQLCAVVEEHYKYFASVK